MVLTESGDQVARVTLINSLGLTVFDTYVKPTSIIKDYRTEFSGITEEIMQKTTITLKQVIMTLKRLISKETILIGHSLDSDLKSLNFFHTNTIDTSVLFPHPRGYPLRRKLKELAKEYLNMNIQVTNKNKKNNSKGHDSQEDALAALNLALFRFENKLEVFDDEAIIAGADIGISPGISLMNRLNSRGVDCFLSSYKKNSTFFNTSNGKYTDPIIQAEKYWIENMSIGCKNVYQNEKNDEILKKFIEIIQKHQEKELKFNQNIEDSVNLTDYLNDSDNNKVIFSFINLNGSDSKQCKSTFSQLTDFLKTLDDSTCLLITSQKDMDPIHKERQCKKILMNSTQLTTSTWNPQRENELKEMILAYNHGAFSYSIV